ncbi:MULTISPECIES: FCSD flavin-binding domain-containing protein [Calditerrivibrio]|uniref:FCSD flavin-binding domain-containing protein n=1 Tax=Calditerrivibrio TaxID=545865 RepID=UPI003C735198
MKRRDFIKTTTALGIGLTLSTKTVFASNEKKELLPKKQTRVAIIGGGFGGATTAKYLKMLDPKLDVVLIDKSDTFYSCPMSNHVIVGLSNIKEITFKYDILQKKYGVKFIKKEVENIDGTSKKLLFKDGFLAYDILVVSPGIGFKYDETIGYTKDAVEVLPHAWKAGEQTLKLANMLKELPKGGTVLLRVPKDPYRCPPGPYERSCLIAWYLKTHKPGSKIFVIDSNDDVVSKGKLFKAAFAELYKDILEYTPDVEVLNIDTKNKVLKTSKGDIKADLINFIPDQKANDSAFKFGLIPEGKLWAPVDSWTLESTLIKDVYVIGDSANRGSFGTVPHSGYIANSMGKVVAEAIVAKLQGKNPPRPFMMNTCYSMVSSEEAIWIATVYEYDDTKKLTVQVGKAGGVPEKRGKIDKDNQYSWANAIWEDTFM